MGQQRDPSKRELAVPSPRRGAARKPGERVLTRPVGSSGPRGHRRSMNRIWFAEARPVTALVAFVAFCFFAGPVVSLVTAQEELPTALSGFEPSEQFDFEDDAHWDPNSEFVIRLLHRAGRVSPENWERFARWTRDVPWRDIVELAPRYRFYVVEVAGRVQRIEPVRLELDIESEDATSRGYYLVWIRRDDGTTVVAACREVPAAWRQLPELDEPTRVTGFFLGRSRFSNGSSDQESATSVPVIVARRPAWFPDRAVPEAGVPQDWVALARMGVDVGLLDPVRRHQNQPLTRDDAPAMYQMLRAMQDDQGTQVAEAARDWLDYLANPAEAVGRAVVVSGHVRRVHWIAIEDPWVRDALGLDGYYELDVFVPLGNRKVNIRQRSVDGEGQPVTIEYEHRFPVTVCASRIPGTPEELRGKRIRVAGFLLRFWNYESDFVSRAAPNAGQISPLIIGRMPEVDSSSRAAIDWFLGGALALMAAAAVVTVWYYRRTDRVVTNPVMVRLLDRPDRLEIAPIDSVEDGEFLEDEDTVG